jgi:XTP/dITP diphosphohydrolase
VAADLIAKLVRRNPHVFGAAGSSGVGPERPDAATINEVWEAIKATEKRRSSVFDGLPPTLPALLLADKVLDRLSRTPVDAEPSVVAPRTVRSGDPAEDIGERLLALVAEARAAGVDPEQALRDVVRRLA